jgi:hypothetical protein
MSEAEGRGSLLRTCALPTLGFTSLHFTSITFLPLRNGASRSVLMYRELIRPNRQGSLGLLCNIECLSFRQSRRSKKVGSKSIVKEILCSNGRLICLVSADAALSPTSTL